MSRVASTTSTSAPPAPSVPVPDSSDAPLDRRPVYTPPRDEGRIVPPRWLENAPVTQTLLALNVVVFVIEILDASPRSFGPFGTEELLRLGASYPFATVGEARWETLVTACFLHGGVLHLAFNMVALWQAGPLVERAVGSARMAPMYLLAGAFGNFLSVANQRWWDHSIVGPSVGASGAIVGVIAAALVVGWRVQGWRGPLTQAMARWLAFVVIFGVVANLTGGAVRIDNAAHIGGAIAGGVIALLWKRGFRYSAVATRAILGVSVGAVLASLGVLAWHDATDRFASMGLQERADFTSEALDEDRCRDARDGLLAVERLRAKMAPVTSMRMRVESQCGHVGER